MMLISLFSKLWLIVIVISISIMLPEIAFSEVILTEEVMGIIKGGACGPASYDAATYTGCVCYVTEVPDWACTNAVKHYGKGKCNDTNSQCCSISDAPLVVCTVTYTCTVDQITGCDIGGTEGCTRTDVEVGRTYGNTTANASGSGCTPGGGASGGGPCG